MPTRITATFTTPTTRIASLKTSSQVGPKRPFAIASRLLALDSKVRRRLEDRAPVRRKPELRPGAVAVEAEHRPPDPRDEVAPVVEVKVRDRDRVQPGPPLALAQA